MPDRPRSRFVFGNRIIGVPAMLYRFFHYASGVKTWTTKRPLVVVKGLTLSSWAGAVAGNWGGGDVVQLDSGAKAENGRNALPRRLLGRLIQRNVRHAFCPDDAAAARMRRYPGCIVEVAPPVIDRLQRLAGIGKPADAGPATSD